MRKQPWTVESQLWELVARLATYALAHGLEDDATVLALRRCVPTDHR